MAGRVRLRVGNILTEAKETISLLGGAGITLTVNDQTDSHDQAEVTITADNSPGGVQEALAAHVAASDPHTQYQKESELNAVNGYAGLDGSAKVAAAHLPTLDAISAPVADVAMNSQKITGLAAPVSGGDAVNKTYADATAAGLYPHDACTAATTANITLSGAQTIDGVSVVATNRVLVKDQTTTKDNGIYVCAAGAWSRSTDADTGAEIKGGSFVYILSGTANGGKGFAATHVGTPNLGTDPITFSQFSGTTGTPSGPAGGVLGGTYPNPTQGLLALTTDLAAYQPTSAKGVSAGYPGAELATNAQTGTSYTLVLADSLKIVSMSNVAANTVTVPPNSSVAFPVGTRLVVKQTNTGTTTLVQGAGVTINTANATLTVGGRYGYVTLVKTATDTWDLVGGVGGGGGSGIPASTVTNKGDMIAATGNATVTNVAVGTDGKVLTADSTAGSGVSWQTPAAAGAGIPAATVTTKGDLIAATANATVTRKAIGVDGTVLTADASQSTGIRWGTPAAGGPFAPDTTLASNVAVGATSFTIPPSAPAGLNGARSALLLIDDGLTTVEIIRATFSGTTGTVSTPAGNGAAQIGASGFLKAHSAGATIRWLRDNKIEPAMVVGGASDEGYGVQAALIYAYRWACQLDCRYQAYGTKVSLFAGTLDVGDGGLTVVGQAPWSHTAYLDTARSLTAPTFDHSTYVLRSAREIDSFTATASNDRITPTNLPQGGHGLAQGAAIAFSAPPGATSATMPGGITPGLTYYVKDFPTATTFRLSTLPGLGDLVDVTSDGGGWLYTNWDSLLRFYVWGRLFVTSAGTDVCGVHLCVQQDNSITSLRTRMDTAASVTDRAISLWITGQISNFGDVETDINGANCVGAVVTADLFSFKGKWWIQYGGNIACTGMIVSGFGHKWAGGELESIFTGSTGIRLVNQVTNCDFGDWLSSSTQDASIPIIEDHTDTNGSYHVGQISGQNYVAWDAANSRDLIGPLGAICHGFHKMHGGRGVEIEGRFPLRVIAGTTTVSIDCKTYLCDTSAGNVTLNLPAGIVGPQISVRSIVAGHSVILHPAGGQSVEGVAGDYTLGLGATITIAYEPVTNSWWLV